MLYRPDLHEPLTEGAWDEGRVRTAVAAVVADADAAYDADELWPANGWDGYGASLPLKNLYAGAGGMVWALDALQPLAESKLDLADVARRTLERFRAEPDFITFEPLPEQKRSGLLNGETGIALVAWKLGADHGLADEILELVRTNVGNEAEDLMWGVPGTLLAARAMQAATGEARWGAAVRESEEALRRSRGDDGVWTQRLYGNEVKLLGPAHGLVGNVLALGETGNAADVLARAAVRENGYANWPTHEGADDLRLQWCHGAPGIVACAAAYLDEELLLAAAQLVWDAGPPHADEKGAGICHGTAGNGYALLKSFERTQDELWLVRARAFAVHALAQVQRLPGRYSLFTGGVGAALFAADCIDGVARFPILDRI